jgi:hypothetical protein
MRTASRCSLGALSLALALPCLSAADAPASKDIPAPEPKESFECRRATSPITLDGKADELAWKNAEVLDNFTPYWLKAKGTPLRKAYTKTTARLLWDEKYLYFHAEMEDADLFADVTEQDGECWNNDVFELFFKPSEEKPYYEFEVTPKNTHFDMFVPERIYTEFAKWFKDREFKWETKVVTKGTLNKRDDRDTGWSVEGRIPWSDFAPTGGGPKAGDAWKFSLCRYDYSVDFKEPELSATAPLTHKNYHYFEDYSTLRFIGAK